LLRAGRRNAAMELARNASWTNGWLLTDPVFRSGGWGNGEDWPRPVVSHVGVCLVRLCEGVLTGASAETEEESRLPVNAPSVPGVRGITSHSAGAAW